MNNTTRPQKPTLLAVMLAGKKFAFKAIPADEFASLGRKLSAPGEFLEAIDSTVAGSHRECCSEDSVFNGILKSFACDTFVLKEEFCIDAVADEIDYVVADIMNRIGSKAWVGLCGTSFYTAGDLLATSLPEVSRSYYHLDRESCSALRNAVRSRRVATGQALTAADLALLAIAAAATAASNQFEHPYFDTKNGYNPPIGSLQAKLIAEEAAEIRRIIESNPLRQEFRSRGKREAHDSYWTAVSETYCAVMYPTEDRCERRNPLAAAVAHRVAQAAGASAMRRPVAKQANSVICKRVNDFLSRNLNMFSAQAALFS